ncbi:GumC family protein [Rhizobium sp. Root1220]|uniref:GumC family protein n=1 Tax=Rhizobium sp. Root1220 TaxID=1736432 RepID=UPI0006F9CB80|nr:GumC family protein [Rhizobium sp. Root1220]KQV84432.1 sugar transporter [Rhizobium sp. Root1220]
MSQIDRNRVSRLPQWRSHEPEDAAPQVERARSPALRPADFARPRTEFVDTLAPDTPAPAPPQAGPQQPEPLVEVTPVQPATVQVAGPLLDLGTAVTAIWNRRRIVLGLAVVGALAGAVVAPLVPQKYTATASLYFDPRNVGPVDPSASSSGVSPDMVSALVDSQVQILTSGNVLRRVAEALNLYEDPEFIGGRTDGAAVIGALQKAVVITRQTTTYVVSLAATTKDPEKSAKLANQVVASFLQEESSASNGLYESTSSALDGRLNDLRRKVQEAEQAVETYRADNDLTATQQGLISDQRLTSLNALLVTVQDKAIQAKTRADAASRLSFEQVVANGQGDQGGVSTALASLRQQYSSQAAVVGSLESQLGGRHPRLQAARSSLQSTADEIRGELQRLRASARAEYDQAKKAEDAVSRELTVQKALQVNSSDKQVELNELQRKSVAARDIYEAVLKRSGQTNEEQNLVRSNTRLISEAEPPVKADGPAKKVILVAGIIGGFFAGFTAGAAFAILAGLVAHPVIRSYLRRPV